MAEFVGLGASVLAFMTVAAKLSRATSALRGSFQDAPSDVQRVQTRLQDIEFTLAQIDRARAMNPECLGDPATESYWAGKEAKLRSDFAEFERFATRLAANIGKAKGKMKWFLSHEDQAKKVLGLLVEDIDVLKALLGIMESNTIGKIYRAQAPAITALTQVARIVDDVNATMVTKQQFEDHHNALRLVLKPCVHASHDPQPTCSTAQGSQSDMLTSSVVMSYAEYYFPLGQISLWYGWRSREPDHHMADEELLLAGQWDFNPASWVSYRSLRIQARLLVQFGEFSRPRITPSLAFRVCVSESHPVWACIRKGDLMGVRRHLSIGSVGVNDTTISGRTLLLTASSVLRDCPGDQTTLRNRYIEILKLLVQSGAEGEAYCSFTIKSEEYNVWFELRNYRRTGLGTPQCTSLSEVDILLNAGAHFLFPIGFSGQNLCPIRTGFVGDRHDWYIDDLKEYLSNISSRDPTTRTFQDREALPILLTEICCGRSPELWDAWREGNALPADEGFSPGALVDDIASLVLNLDRPRRRRDQTYDMLNTLFRTGDIDAGNGVLLLFINRRPSFAESLGDLFSWQAVMLDCPVDFLGKNSDRTQELLERCGADLSCLLYYRMVSVPELAYWEETIEKGVNDKVLNSLLLFSAAYCPVVFVEYLLARGASVNFRGSCIYGLEWSALAYAAQRGERDIVTLLLGNGADVLQEFRRPRDSDVTASQLVDSCNPDLVQMLTRLEDEERAKRDIVNVPAPIVIQSRPEYPAPRPKQLYEHLPLAIGVFLMALLAIHHLFLQSLGWCLKNRRLLWWVFWACCENARACLAMFAWAPLVVWVTLIELVLRFLVGVDLGVTR